MVLHPLESKTSKGRDLPSFVHSFFSALYSAWSMIIIININNNIIVSDIFSKCASFRHAIQGFFFACIDSLNTTIL